MESWRYVWRNGFAPLLSTLGLDALRKALKRDDPRIMQGETTVPIAINSNRYRKLEGCCALGYCTWRGEGLDSVGEIDGQFGQLCAEADQRLGEPQATRYFLNWYDEVPRNTMRFELLTEVERTLRERFPLAAARTDRAAA